MQSDKEKIHAAQIILQVAENETHLETMKALIRASRKVLEGMRTPQEYLTEKQIKDTWVDPEGVGQYRG
jgi:hypothetical protein